VSFEGPVIFMGVKHDLTWKEHQIVFEKCAEGGSKRRLERTA
jgi:hypothetical protein